MEKKKSTKHSSVNIVNALNSEDLKLNSFFNSIKSMRSQLMRFCESF